MQRKSAYQVKEVKLKEREYNLADEKWICLLSKDGTVVKAGLRETMLRANEFLDLGGEMRLQDVAIMRLLTALSVTILYRYDENGNRSELENAAQAEERFKKIWKSGKYCEKAVNSYFEEWHDRFYLFDKEHPFFQIPEKTVEWKARKGVLYPYFPNGVYMNYFPMGSVNGLVLISANKPYPVFSTLSREQMDTAEYDEAARWMVFYNAFADCTAGKQQRCNGKSANAGRTLPSRGALLTPVGDENLFQTIMLGSMLFDVGGRRLYETCSPVWEEKEAETDKVERNMPDDLPRAYTQQARRMLLKKEGGLVKGIFVSAGESYKKEDLIKEPCFVLKKADGKKRIFLELNKDLDIWEEVQYITGTGDDGSQQKGGAKICDWINMLQNDEDLLPDDKLIRFRVSDIDYVKSDCGYKWIREDQIVLNRNFLQGSEKTEAIKAEIKNIHACDKILQNFEDDCRKCRGWEPVKKSKNEKWTLDKLYHQEIGVKVREYLAGSLDLEDLREAEYEAACKTARRHIKEYEAAMLRGKSGDKGMTLGEAEARFWKKMNSKKKFLKKANSSQKKGAGK